jgi:MFS family permease
MSVVPGSHEPNSQGSLTETAAAPEPALAPLEAQTAMREIPRLQPLVFVYVVGAALVAGLLAWGIGEKTHDYYQVPVSAQGSRDFTALNREERISDQKNTAIAYGTFGALLGVFSGAAGGALRRSIPGGVGAALAGLVLGGIGVALVSFALAPVFARFYSDENATLLLSFLVRGGIWAVVGMSAGLALGWGWRGLRGVTPVLTGGMAGGVCGTIAFELGNALLFPADRNDAVIPSSMQARLLAYLFVSVGVALGGVYAGHGRPTAANGKSLTQE